MVLQESKFLASKLVSYHVQIINLTTAQQHGNATQQNYVVYNHKPTYLTISEEKHIFIIRLDNEPW